MREALSRVLGAAGFRVSGFASAEALLETGIAATAACLVLDVRLPGLSGFELRRRLLASGISIPVIFISAVDSEAGREEARRLGAVYFAKPILGRHLIEAVTKAIHPQASKMRA